MQVDRCIFETTCTVTWGYVLDLLGRGAARAPDIKFKLLGAIALPSELPAGATAGRATDDDNDGGFMLSTPSFGSSGKRAISCRSRVVTILPVESDLLLVACTVPSVVEDGPAGITPGAPDDACGFDSDSRNSTNSSVKGLCNVSEREKEGRPHTRKGNRRVFIKAVWIGVSST